MILLFDTETTGIIKSNDSPARVQPRLIEFYGLRLDAANPDTILGDLHLLVDPGQPRAEWPVIKDLGENGSMLTEEMLTGAPAFPLVLPKLQDFFLGAEFISAHNLTFDHDVLYAELRRVDAVTRFPWPPRRICTVEATEQIAGRRMSLTDLHMHLFGVGFDEAHLARRDVEALHRCFVELWKRGIIKTCSRL